MNTISIYELKKISSPIIIDIRDNYSYSISHVKNAINIPYYNLLNNYSHEEVMYFVKEPDYLIENSETIFNQAKEWTKKISIKR